MADKLGFLNNLGSDRSILSTNLKLTQVEDVLQLYANRIASQADQNLRSNKYGKDSNASGSLSGSIVITPVTFFGGNYTVEIKMADYWKWVENGRKAGKRPPVSAIMKWIKDKQLRLDDGGTTKRGYKREGTLISASKKKVVLKGRKVSILEATAYKIAEKIGRVGTKGTNFLTDAIDDNIKDLSKAMAQALGRDVVKFIRG